MKENTCQIIESVFSGGKSLMSIKKKMEDQQQNNEKKQRKKFDSKGEKSWKVTERRKNCE